MKHLNIKRLTKLTMLLAMLVSQGISAHSAGGPIDGAGNNANATDFGVINCSDDGNGPAAYLIMQIEDTSPSVPGLLMSLQISKDLKMINVTDPVSGDGNPSAGIKMSGGNGSYNISINKTSAGLRNFTISYHCMTINDVHTGTDINAYQLQ